MMTREGDKLEDSVKWAFEGPKISISIVFVSENFFPLRRFLDVKQISLGDVKNLWCKKWKYEHENEN